MKAGGFIEVWYKMDPTDEHGVRQFEAVGFIVVLHKMDPIDEYGVRQFKAIGCFRSCARGTQSVRMASSSQSDGLH